MATIALGDIVIYTETPGVGEVFTPTRFPAVVVGNKGVDENGDSIVDLHVFLPELSIPTETNYDEEELALRNAARSDVHYGAAVANENSWHEKT